MTDTPEVTPADQPEPTVDEQLAALVREYRQKIVREVLDRVVDAQFASLRQLYVDHGLAPPSHLHRELGALGSWMPALIAGGLVTTAMASLINWTRATKTTKV